MAVCLVQNLRFHQEHQVVVSKLHVPDALVEAKALEVPDVVHSDVDNWGAGRLYSIADMVERVSESDWHCVPCSSSDLWG